MSASNSLHYELCCKGATWIRQPKNHDKWKAAYTLSAVELICLTAENPDIYATNGYESCIIEVKTSHSDFLADQKKLVRKDSKYAIGNFRYYLCPEGIIKPEELPANWGLLYYDGRRIRRVLHARQVIADKTWDTMLLMSIMRREGLLGRTFNYRKPMEG